MSSRPRHYRTRYEADLSPRQEEILGLLAQGLTNGQIGERLGMTLDGAKWHVGEIISKLGVDSREEAAAYWRDRNSLRGRVARGLFAFGAIGTEKLVVGAAAALVVVGAAVVAVVLAMGGGEGSTPGSPGETPSPEPTGQSQTATPATPTGAPTSPTPSLSSTGTASRRFDVPNGGAVPGDSGLLYIDLETGAMEFWSTPGGYGARPISRDGRWVVWGAPAVDRPLLLDTVTGNERQVLLGGRPAAVVGFSGDGRLMLLRGDARVALVETESGRVLAAADLPPAASSGAAEFAPDGSVAHPYGAGAGAATVVLRPNGSTLTINGGWPVRWSPDGTRLVVTTDDGLQIVDGAGKAVATVALGGQREVNNPRWSPDGRYLAVANEELIGGQRVFDAATGREVLRTTGTSVCLSDHWLDDGTLRFGWEGKRVAVPSGKVLDGSPPTFNPGYSYDQDTPPGITRILLANGKTAEFQSAAPYSSYYDGEGVHSTTTNGRLMLLIGVGGRGLCGGGPSEPLAVDLPPFDD